MDELFRLGGSHNIRRTGIDQYEMTISVPAGRDGLVGRDCPNSECSPGYFRVKLGTGITEPGYEKCFCPYCGHEGESGEFLSKAQRDYLHSVFEREASAGIERMVSNALGLGPSGRRRIGGGLVSIEMSMKKGHQPSIRHPYEDILKRDVTCPNCKLMHAVYGLATWCADCGRDIFLTHVEAELEVVRKVLGEVEAREERLGTRVAARDIENALEDAVSIFEAVLRHIVRRRLLDTKCADTEERVRRIGNSLQNVARAQEVVRREVGVEPFAGISTEEVATLRTTFEKRHPITHNLGVVDRKFRERVTHGGGLGVEVMVTRAEVEGAIELASRVLASLYQRLFLGEEQA